MTRAPLEDWLAACRPRIDATLARLLAPADSPEAALGAACEHAVMLGGKRLRPALTLAACEALGGDEAIALPTGAAVEMIHAYSLVHDDLPAMDDDVLRRGQPTVHVRFGEATAILAGDALQTRAFEVLAGETALDTLTTGTRLAMIGCLARAAGATGMVGGQALDMAATGRRIEEQALAAMHARKTGALIAAAAELGALASGRADPAAIDALGAFGRTLGLAFQVVDDLLDATGDTPTLGKTAGADAAAGKATYVGLLGVDGARRRAQRLCDEARTLLDALEQPGRLPDFVAWVQNRRH